MSRLSARKSSAMNTPSAVVCRSNSISYRPPCRSPTGLVLQVIIPPPQTPALLLLPPYGQSDRLLGGLPAQHAARPGDAQHGGVAGQRRLQRHAGYHLATALAGGQVEDGVGGIDPEPLVTASQRQPAGAGRIANVDPRPQPLGAAFLLCPRVVGGAGAGPDRLVHHPGVAQAGDLHRPASGRRIGRRRAAQRRPVHVAASDKGAPVAPRDHRRARRATPA